MVEQTCYLPVQPTPLIGRDQEVAAVSARLCEPGVRLLTLSGPGGVGKTRLALAVATDLAETFDLGAIFVDLASIRDPALVATTVAQSVGIWEAGHRPAHLTLADYLRGRSVLVIVDNFEHVLPAAPQLAEMLGACPSLRVLVTSRAALHLRWEHEISVAPLALTSAIELFIERARTVGSALALTPENREAIAAICARLDGLPLAIELAAARVRLLPPSTLLERLERRLPLLTGGPRDLPARQRTLRDAIAWSEDLLTADERALFRRMAVFAGGGTPEAVAAVCAEGDDPTLEALEGIDSLLEKSLLRQGTGPDGAPRFLMLETVREFAAERLAASGEADAVRQQHAAYFLALAEAEPTDAAANQRWLTLLDAEYANVRAALTWSHADPDGETERRLVAALGWFWFNAGYLGEGRAWLEGALARPGWDDARPAWAQALLGLGRLAWDQGDLVTARPVLEQSVALCRQTGNARGLGWALTVLGQVALGEGDPAARTVAEAGVAQLRTVGEPFGLVIAVAFRGWAMLADGDRPLARTCFEESLALSRAAGAEGYAANVLRGLGYIALADGEADQAAARFGESLVRNREPRERRALAGCVAALAGVALARGQPECASRLLGAATGVLESAGIPRLYPFDQPSYDRTRTAACSVLGKAAFAVAEAAGRVVTLEEAVAEALLAGAASPSAATSTDALSVPRGLAEPRPAGLSERELEVLRLLAAGRSNPEIAEALVISLNTVYRHVNHIFTKLGVSNRTEAATLAQRQGLV